MILGQKAHTAGDVVRYLVDYSRWLEEGTSLVTAAVILDAASNVTGPITITGLLVLTSHNRIGFLLSVPAAAVNQTFTLDVQITDTRGETKNDTLKFNVIAP